MILPSSLVAAWLPVVADALPGAYRTDQIVGVAVSILTAIAILIFGFVSIINAVVKKTAGWIVAGSLSAVAFVMIAILTMTGFPRGFNQAYEIARQRNAENVGTATEARVVTGQVLPFRIELPAGWKLQRKQAAYDVLLSADEDRIGVIAEQADVGGTENLAQLARDRIQTIGTDVTLGDEEPISIDGRHWIAFTVKCKVQMLPFTYEYYVYSDTESAFQIMGWTFQNLWENEAPALRRVMQTFRFPPSKEADSPKPQPELSRHAEQREE